MLYQDMTEIVLPLRAKVSVILSGHFYLLVSTQLEIPRRHGGKSRSSEGEVSLQIRLRQGVSCQRKIIKKTPKEQE